jgi:alcohol dehydrogenase
LGQGAHRPGEAHTMAAFGDRELRKFVTPEVVWGPGARHLVGQYALNIGASKVLLVTDAGVEAAGWSAEVATSLERSGVPFTVFRQVTSNPRADEVMLGMEVYRAGRCDALVAVGGGSPIDCAKGIGMAVTNGCHVLEMAGVDRIAAPIPPLLCVPTTAGSAADLSQFALLTDPSQRRKLTIISKAIVPDVALVDAETTATMSPYLTACTGIDALIHAIEAYTSTGHSPLTDPMALEAIEVAHGSLIEAVASTDPASPARARMMRASMLAGLAFSNASLGAVHAMAHSVGGLLDNPHGEANAMLLEHVVAFNYPAAPERFERIARVMGLAPVSPGAARLEQLLTAVRALKRTVGLDARLGHKGVKRTDVAELARRACADPCIATNPRVMKLRDVEVVYEEAL